jgi:eukaryotic-like serine/threonine-protein kinase
MIAQGSRLKDRYRVERLLGHGGMAAVWLAEDEVLDRSVAVKVLADTIASDPEFLARFRREARVAAGLSHPNLIRIYDYAEGDERPYLVSEYVPGETLSERLERHGEIDCWRLARELLGALAHIHAAGIVHRDVKPQNVLLAPDGNAKLIDFGIALPKDATALTRTGHLLGTARYIAPEVMAGKPATERSDLFSCGVLLRECLGDHPPRHLRGPVARLADEDPERRPASAAQALALIDRKAPTPEQKTQPFAPTIERPTSAPPAAPPQPQRAAPRRLRLPWSRAAAVLAIVAGLALAMVLFTAGSSDQPRQAREGKARGQATVAANDKPNEASPSARKASSGTEAPAPEKAAIVPQGADPATGSALNEEGFELLQAGEYEEAVSVLEAAVRAFPAGTEDLDYAYALFNLGNALRLGGRPEEAIPILEQRLAIPNQTETVRAELEAAEREAGLSGP